MRTVRLLDLFSGIGGFSLAATWAGIKPVQFVEFDSYCQKVLQKNFPGVPIHGDIKTFKGTTGSADIVSGGFPCQPFSCAGKQRGSGDDRYLWPEMLRVIKETRPTWIIGENVAGIHRMELDKIIADLEANKYRSQTFIIPACALDAKHRRDRVWIISNTECGNGNERGRKTRKVEKKTSNKFERYSRWATEPGMDRVAYGVPGRVDRLRGLGNAIVPQVAFEIFRIIKLIEEGAE